MPWDFQPKVILLPLLHAPRWHGKSESGSAHNGYVWHCPLLCLLWSHLGVLSAAHLSIRHVVGIERNRVLH